MYDSIEHWGVDADGNKTLLYKHYTVEGQPVPDTKPPDPPDTEVPIAGVITSNGVRVRNEATTIGTDVIGVFNLGDQAFFEADTYPPTTDNNSWLRVVKVNGANDPRIGGYVAKQYVNLNEGTPIPKS
jgi:hypothetical protein